MAGAGGALDSDGVLHNVTAPAVVDRCHSARVVLGAAPGEVSSDDAVAILGMFDVTAAEVKALKRGRRRVVRKRL